ncbi:MAG: hypothetical protein FJX00_01715 [Alphaproteobacteria bacterium]|nr:hypothetical protein [Alphaproteobacteria bacterium]
MLSSYLIFGMGLSAAKSDPKGDAIDLVKTSNDILLGQDDSGQHIWSSVETKQSSNAEASCVVDSTLQK